MIQNNVFSVIAATAAGSYYTPRPSERKPYKKPPMDAKTKQRRKANKAARQSRKANRK